MEEMVVLLIPVLLAILLIRALLLPIRLILKLGIHLFCGFFCLWLLNILSPFTGICFPVNTVTTLLCGTLGLPGIALLAALAVLG